MTTETKPMRAVIAAGARQAQAALPDETPKPEEPAPFALPPLPSEHPVARSIQDIIGDRNTETEQPVVPPKPVARDRAWLFFLGLATFVVVVAGIAVGLAQPATTTYPIASSPAPDLQASPQATVVPMAPTTDPHLPLSARYPVQGVSEADVKTTSVSETQDGVVFFRDGNSIGVSWDGSSTCVPAWASPGPQWGAGDDARKKFESERLPCFDPSGKKIRITGWYGDTNWVFVIRCAPPECPQPELFWTDITWLGHTAAEVKALPEAMSGKIKDYQPLDPPTPLPQPTAPPYQPPANSGSYRPVVIPTMCSNITAGGVTISACGTDPIEDLNKTAAAEIRSALPITQIPTNTPMRETPTVPNGP